MTVQFDPKDDALPATKGDVRLLKDDLSVVKGDVRLLKDDLSVVKGDILFLKADVQNLGTSLRSEMKADKEEIMRHFDVVAENLVKDFRDANNDKWSLHDDQIRELQVHTGLRAA